MRRSVSIIACWSIPTPYNDAAAADDEIDAAAAADDETDAEAVVEVLDGEDDPKADENSADEDEAKNLPPATLELPTPRRCEEGE
jgi:hypothetical protein